MRRNAYRGKATSILTAVGVCLAIAFGAPAQAFASEVGVLEGMEAIEPGVLMGGAASADGGDESQAMPLATIDDQLAITATFRYDLASKQLELTNEGRESVGVAKLVMNKQLQECAMQRAIECAVNFSHMRPDGTSCFTAFPRGNSAYGENILVNHSTAEGATTDWMGSAYHKANMLNSKFVSVGIGCAKVGSITYWVQCFGTLSAEGYAGAGDQVVTRTVDVSYDTVPFKGGKAAFNRNMAQSDPEPINVGGTYELQLGVSNPGWSRVYAPTDASTCKWSSSNPSVATVDSDGVVKAVSVGTATITATTKYGGFKVTKNFRVQIPISSATVTVEDQTYTGTALTPIPTVVLNGTTLKYGTDFTLYYYNNTNIGTAELTVYGAGDYSGAKVTHFEIKRISITDASVTVPDSGFTYSGTKFTPTPTVKLAGKTLKEGTDYTLSFNDNINAGTATVVVTGKGIYTDKAYGTFEIKPASLSSAKVVAYDRQYWGEPLEALDSVYLGNKRLKKNTDYTVAYYDNVNVGTARVVVTGKGNYTGSAEKSFKITQCPISNATVKVADQVYTGKPLTPEPTVKENGYVLKRGVEYDVSYSNNVNVGTAKVAITGKGNYAGTAEVTFKITKGDSGSSSGSGSGGSDSGSDSGDSSGSTQPTAGKVTMYRLYNKYTGEHFYTANKAEKDNLANIGWTYEGVGWTAPSKSSTPVYRLYNKYVPGGDHHYTTNMFEVMFCEAYGWTYEGIGWYSDDAEGTPLYRQYNPYAATGTHNYTTSKAENDFLVSVGWSAEGVAWYGVK
ncbi:CAP domain-containing protein [Paratractidigestivibacter sp.]|uniref:CAP domain-containing protein n=1 Tax=Paratractidigestivibacter sp. TaxID=2847316 RepID=UPI002AC944F4|nr:CAP domain-containing protein [Paratractidigestivibacter sp.]